MNRADRRVLDLNLYSAGGLFQAGMAPGRAPIWAPIGRD